MDDTCQEDNECTGDCDNCKLDTCVAWKSYPSDE